jgi:hypothetical protein
MPEIKVQVVPSPDRARQLAPGKTWESLDARVGELGESIADIAKRLREQLDSGLATTEEPGWQLDDVELKFSLDLEAEAGVILARAKTTAGFEVTLTWSRR